MRRRARGLLPIVGLLLILPGEAAGVVIAETGTFVGPPFFGDLSAESVLVRNAPDGTPTRFWIGGEVIGVDATPPGGIEVRETSFASIDDGRIGGNIALYDQSAFQFIVFQEFGGVLDVFDAARVFVIGVNVTLDGLPVAGSVSGVPVDGSLHTLAWSFGSDEMEVPFRLHPSESEGAPFIRVTELPEAGIATLGLALACVAARRFRPHGRIAPSDRNALG